MQRLSTCKNIFQPGFRNVNILRFFVSFVLPASSSFLISLLYEILIWEKNPVIYILWSISGFFLYLFFKLPLESQGNWKSWLLAQLVGILKCLAICSSFFSITASKNTSLFFKSSFLDKECDHWNVKPCQQKVVSCSKYKVVIVIFQIQSYNVSTENPSLLLVETGEQYSSVFLQKWVALSNFLRLV